MYSPFLSATKSRVSSALWLLRLSWVVHGPYSEWAWVVTENELVLLVEVSTWVLKDSMPIFCRRTGLMGPSGLLQRCGSLWMYLKSHKTLKEKKKCTQKCKIFQKSSEDAGKCAEYMPFWRRFQDLVLRQFVWVERISTQLELSSALVLETATQLELSSDISGWVLKYSEYLTT